ncbi:MAG: efflux RND transporter periplasmic adaptor subunit [Polyangiaceae bacterium]|nr:efflux RND transporter periplasmic adaptor subunit [Polyangiaceae bacterium]
MSAPTGWARRLRRLLPYAAIAVAGAAGVIALKTRPVEATTARVETGPVVREAVGTGTIESEAQVSLAFTIPGRITEIRVHEGAQLKAGDLLATLDAGQHEQELAVARRGVDVAAAAVVRSEADIRRAQAALDAAALDQRRIEVLFSAGAVAAAEIDTIRDRVARARAELDAAHAVRRQGGGSVALARETVGLHARRAEDTALRSPIDGIVVRRAHEPGDVVAPGAVVLVVASTRKVWARAWMDETVLHELREGQEARVVLRGEPSRPLRARVDRIAVEADRQTHELLADIELLERPSRLAFGQRADAFVTLERRAGVTRVPRGACEVTSGRCFVEQGGRVGVASVRFGLIGDEWVEVLEGVSPGDVLLAPRELGAALPIGRRVRRGSP